MLSFQRPRLASRLLPLLVLSAACGGAPPPAAPTPPKPEARAEPQEEPKEKAFTELPTECTSKDEGVCLPPDEFAKRLCGGSFPDIALAMFAKGTPWTRGYLRRDTEAWNASGGASSSDKLVFDEEVLILVQRKPEPGAMVVNGSGGSYDVLRWDGTCASLMAEEVTTRLPPAPKYAKIPWRKLEDATQNALLGEDAISKLVEERKKECKGGTMSAVSDKCAKVESKLSKLIAAFIRKGGLIPAPTRLP